MKNLFTLKNKKVLLSFVLFSFLIGNVMAQTATITIDVASAGGSSNLGSNAYGGGAERTWTQNGVGFGGKAITTNPNNTPAGFSAGQLIQAQAGNGVIYNTTPFPGRIVSITINQTGTVSSACFGGATDRLVNNVAANYTVSGGTQVGAASSTGWTTTDFAETDYTFFAITRNSFTGAAYFTTIVIEYETGNEIDDTPPQITFNLFDGEVGVSVDQDIIITSDETLYKDGTALTDFTNADWQNLITFDVPFTASIDAAGEVITVTPTANLAYLTTYTLTLGAVQDAAGNTTSDFTISFTTEVDIANQETLAQWNGYTQVSTATPPFLATDGIVANVGVAALTRDAAGAGFAVNADGVAASTTWNGANAYWIVTFSTTGYENLTITSRQRGSNTGPRDFQLQYLDATSTWTNVAGGAITVGNDNYVTGVLNNLALPVELNNQASVSLRWLVTTSNAISGTLAASGVNRLDVTVFGVAQTGGGTGISEVTRDNFNLYASNGHIHFTASSAGEMIEIYNVTGQRVYHGITVEGANSIAVNAGIILVKIGNAVNKIIVR
jgi:hypothetical protein